MRSAQILGGAVVIAGLATGPAFADQHGHPAGTPHGNPHVTPQMQGTPRTPSPHPTPAPATPTPTQVERGEHAEHAEPVEHAEHRPEAHDRHDATEHHRTTTTTTTRTHGNRHTTTSTATLNPIAAKISRHPQQAARIERMLPAGMTLNQASRGFRNQGQFIAALHVSRNLHIPFVDLKRAMTGPNAMSLGQAIHTLRPSTDTDAAVRRANTQAQSDVH